MATRTLAAEVVANGIPSAAAVSGAGADEKWKGQNAGSGNTDGGDVVIEPGAKSGSGVNGVLAVRQPGGVAGTDEVQIYHDGTAACVESKDGALLLKAGDTTVFTLSGGYITGQYAALSSLIYSSVVAPLGSVGPGMGQSTGFGLPAALTLGWSATTLWNDTHDTGLARSAAGVVKVTDGSTGLGDIVAKTVIARQSGGVAGTDEVQISHNGTYALIESKDGGFHLKAGASNLDVTIVDDGTFSILSASIYLVNTGGGGYTWVSNGRGLASNGLRLLSTDLLKWQPDDNIGISDTGLARSAAGVIKVTDGASGGGQLEFPQVADVGTPSSNSARIGAEDVSGTAELIASDEAGNETQLTPHAADGPASLYDDVPGVERVSRTTNRYTGVVSYLNLDRLAAAVAAGTPAECRHVETLADWCARTGRVKPRLDWDEVQASHQAKYDSARADEAAKVTEWESLPKDERGDTPQPLVRDAADIRKPKPDYLAKK